MSRRGRAEAGRLGQGATVSSSNALNDRYALGPLIGRGSSASVHAATDLRFGRTVTVKLFHPAIAADPGLRARFERQTAKSAQLNHPNIVAVLDAGFTQDPEDGECPFVVTEPAGPTSLRGLLDVRGRLAPEQAVGLTRQVASALSYAHQRGLVHADVKPENVLVDDGGRNAKLVDFSLSFVSTATGVMSVETLSRRAAYLAPEQVRGEPVGPATDVYALGVLLYEMLLGRPPFVGATPQATADRRVTESARPASIFDPSVPPAIEQVINRALERGSGQRWESVAELDEALGRAGVASSPARPAPSAPLSPSPAPPAWGGCRRTELGTRIAQLLVPIGAIAVALGLALWSIGPLLAALGSLPRPNAAPEVAVPHVIGMTPHDARKLAQEHGLELQVVGDRVSEREPRGVIVQQSPVAGRQPKPDQPVRVTLSAGVKAPDVRGKWLADATAELSAKGWKVARVDRSAQPGHPTDAVVIQSPSPDDVVPAPGEMALVVAQ